MTQQEPGQLGRIIGQLVGGLGLSAMDAIDKADKKNSQGDDTSWIKELPGTITKGLYEARMNIQSPIALMQAEQAKQNMVAQGLQMQNTMSLINGRNQTLRMQAHDQEVLPQWLRDHPTWESRQDAEPPVLYTPQGQKMFRDIQLGDTANIKNKAQVAGVTAFGKQIDELMKYDPVAAGQFASQLQPGRVPTAKMQQDISVALGKAQAQSKQEQDEGQIVEKKFSDGTVLKGYQIGKQFHEFKDQKTAPSPKISSALQSEMTLYREEILSLQKQIGALDPNAVGDKAKKVALEQQLKEANDKYYSVLSEARVVQSPSAPNTPATSAAPAAAGPKDDPLGLFK